MSTPTACVRAGRLDGHLDDVSSAHARCSRRTRRRPSRRPQATEPAADPAAPARCGLDGTRTPRCCRARRRRDATAAESGEPPADTRALDETVQDLKKDVVDLNRELFVLEEELLFPANTQVAVFVSMDIGEFFALDSLTLKIDNKEVANYLYTPREAEALLKGGVHRVYLGNLKVGEHQLVAFFSGKGPQRTRLQARRESQVREGRGRQVSRAQDHRPPASRSARVRDQGLGIRFAGDGR